MPKLLKDDTTDADFIDIGGNFEDVSELDNDIEAQINAITGEFGGQEGDDEFKINVKRIMNGKGKIAHLFSCLPNELPILDRLADDYGGGDFEIWIYRNNKIFKRRRVSVECPIKKSPTENNHNINQRIDRLGELIAAGQASNQAQPVAASPADTMSSMMQQMILMKEFLAPPPQSNPLEMIKEVLSIQKMLLPGSVEASPESATTSDVLLELTKTFGRPIADLTMRAQASADNAAKPSADKKPIKEENPMRMKIAMLLNFAKRNVDPAPYAQMVIDSAPNLEEFLTFVRSPDVIDKMIAIHPGVANHVEWFDELATLILEFTDTSAPEEPESEPESDPENDEIIDGEIVDDEEEDEDEDEDEEESDILEREMEEEAAARMAEADDFNPGEVDGKTDELENGS